MVFMLANVRKRFALIFMSAVALGAGLGALVLNKTATADTTVTNNLPQLLSPHNPPPCVPEVNTGLVLVPIGLAIFLLNWRHLLRQRSLQKR
jgi:hypothetical protein